MIYLMRLLRSSQGQCIKKRDTEMYLFLTHRPDSSLKFLSNFSIKHKKNPNFLEGLEA